MSSLEDYADFLFNKYRELEKILKDEKRKKEELEKELNIHLEDIAKKLENLYSFVIDGFDILEENKKNIGKKYDIFNYLQKSELPIAHSINPEKFDLIEYFKLAHQTMSNTYRVCIKAINVIYYKNKRNLSSDNFEKLIKDVNKKEEHIKKQLKNYNY